MIGSSINQSDALRRVLTGHGMVNIGSGPEELIDAVIAEYLRCTLRAFAGSADGTGTTAIYITKLTNAVRRQLAPLWPRLYSFRDQGPSKAEQEAEGDLEPDRVRRVLERLSDLRDVAALGDGYWLPAPVRLVALPEQDRALFVGGLGTVEAKRLLSTPLEETGITRVVKSSALPKSLQSDPQWWQSYNDWRGEPPTDLRDWTEALITSSGQNMGVSAADFTGFEIYAPWLRPKDPQYFRWLRLETFVDQHGSTTKGLVLCRSLPGRIKMPRKYWLGQINHGALRSEAPVHQSVVRRLQYGLDLLSAAPTRAMWEDSGFLILRSWLPPEEQRPVLAFARDVSTQPGRFPLKYTIAPKWRPLILSLLEGLGIEVIQK